MTALKSKPTIYNIQAGMGFADALAQGILEQAQNDPLKLPAYTVLLPSRRACRTLRDAFLRLSQGDGLLLPRLSPIGDVDADELQQLPALLGPADQRQGTRFVQREQQGHRMVFAQRSSVRRAGPLQ